MSLIYCIRFSPSRRRYLALVAAALAASAMLGGCESSVKSDDVTRAQSGCPVQLHPEVCNEIRRIARDQMETLADGFVRNGRIQEGPENVFVYTSSYAATTLSASSAASVLAGEFEAPRFLQLPDWQEPVIVRSSRDPTIRVKGQTDLASYRARIEITPTGVERARIVVELVARPK